MKRVLAFFALLIFVVACTQQQYAPQPMPPQQVQEAVVSIATLSAPTSVGEEQTFKISWKVDGPETTITHTAIHYDSRSYPGEFGTDITPQAAGYKNLTPEFASTTSTIPNTFTAILTAPVGVSTIYFRAHVIVSGKNYWTPEQVITVTKLPQPTTTTSYTAPPKEFTIEADDSGFYPSSIAVQKGDSVLLTFKVRTTNVYHAGLDFRSDKFYSPSVDPGSTWTYKFAADSSFKVGSYWPTTSVHKADLTVSVS